MRFVWRVLALPIGLFFGACTWLVTRTSRVALPADAPKPAIYVNWHRHLPLTMWLNGLHGRWLMMSGSPYMAPIAAWARLMGLRLVRGATGAGGRTALAALEEKLRAGESVVLAVDGPAGPVFRVKPGCAELAVATGLPIVVLAYRGRGTFETPGRWDHQLLARPFADVRFETTTLPPAAGETRDALLERVQAAMAAYRR